MKNLTMQNTSDYLILISTCPDQTTADKLATLLINQRLAACVNILPTMQSIYEWQGQLVNESELLLLIKTRRDRYADIEQLWATQHPYQVPELLALSIETGLPNYLAWLDSVVLK